MPRTEAHRPLLAPAAAWPFVVQFELRLAAVGQEEAVLGLRLAKFRKLRPRFVALSLSLLDACGDGNHLLVADVLSHLHRRALNLGPQSVDDVACQAAAVDAAHLAVGAVGE